MKPIALAASTAMALLGAIPPVAAQTGAAPFCLQTPTGTRCAFGTMGECERARGSTTSAQCITRTDAQGTTGLGEPPTPYAGPRMEPPTPPTGSRAEPPTPPTGSRAEPSSPSERERISPEREGIGR
jgi:hypothetical protein